MKQEIYQQILSMMHTYGSRDCLKTIALQFPGVTYNTLVSIYSQDYQKKTRKNHHKHHKPEVMEAYYKRYLSGVSQDSGEPVLLRIAEEVDLSHSLLARIVLVRHLSHTCYEEQNPPKGVVSQMMKDPLSLIEDKTLANEVHQCILNDPNYGPLADNIKRSVGYEYEFILRERLKNRGIPFLEKKTNKQAKNKKTIQIRPGSRGKKNHLVEWPLLNSRSLPIIPVVFRVVCTNSASSSIQMVERRATIKEVEGLGLRPDLHQGSKDLNDRGEDDLRSRGYDKTPDCKLEIPIAVDGCVVNWIESKASFGDEYNHQTNLKDQFWSYWNRFGPGLVIYWFGFIDELDCNRERGIILKDDFPTDIITLESLLETS
ncbi:CDAN1-interacting nuclease 1-like isoform X2 [Pocillopora verrucosa]|uniref:CDAN1-interacting nuclease 1-like isoform X2 n=1 Tax=Pocillopora verrucosa TaxID=203993 RepID=UPI003341FEC1